MYYKSPSDNPNHFGECRTYGFFLQENKQTKKDILMHYGLCNIKNKCLNGVFY